MVVTLFSCWLKMLDKSWSITNV